MRYLSNNVAVRATGKHVAIGELEHALLVHFHKRAGKFRNLASRLSDSRPVTLAAKSGRGEAKATHQQPGIPLQSTVLVC